MVGDWSLVTGMTTSATTNNEPPATNHPKEAT
jgi:hypothetical protein